MSARIKLTPAEIRPYTKRSNVIGAWLLLFNWCLIATAFALPILWLHPLTIAISILLLANRQLGLAILMHECAHYSLFSSRALNQQIGRFLCAAPVIADLDGYRKYHMRHHSEAGTNTDPDYPNYKNYPVSNISMARKIARDLCGITAAKTFYATVLMNAGVLSYDMSYQSHAVEQRLPVSQALKNLAINLSLPIFTHVIMWGLLYSLGHGWIYALWWLSYFTVYMFLLRIRNAAEHGSVPDLLDSNPMKHARTTQASWWERMTFAPNHVNYHMEHHLRPDVPCYQLKGFHQYLKDSDLLRDTKVANGYIDVVRQLVKHHPAEPHH